MAYAFTTTVRAIGPTDYLVEIEETDCGPADEAQIGSALLQGVPLLGRVIRQTVVWISGSATTVNGILGEVPDPPANPYRVVCQNNPAAQPLPLINDTQGVATYKDPTVPVPTKPWGILYHRSQPDAGADNVIRTYYHIKSGW